MSSILREGYSVQACPEGNTQKYYILRLKPYMCVWAVLMLPMSQIGSKHPESRMNEVRLRLANSVHVIQCLPICFGSLSQFGLRLLPSVVMAERTQYILNHSWFRF